MNKNRIESHIDLLSQINKVEAPPFLLTRINQKLQSESSQFFSPRITRLIIAIFFLVLILNISLLVRNSNESDSGKSIAESMHLLPTNSLYK